MDLSLDDIIKKKNIKRGSQNQRGTHRSQPLGSRRNNMITVGRNNNKPLQSNRGRGSANKTPVRGLQNANKPRGQFSNKNGSFVDARMKIIQKSRQRITDARDKLSELAKQTDARTKIKSRNQGTKMTRPTQIPGRRDRGTSGRGSVGRGNFNRMNTNFSPVLQRSIRNPAANMRDNLDPSSLIRCTINRPMPEFSVGPAITYDDEINMDFPMPVHPHDDLSSIKVVTQNEYTNYGGQQDYMPSVPEPMYMDHYDTSHSVYNRQPEPPPRPLALSRSGVRMSQEMRARLDSPAKQFIVAPARPPAFPGHRIVVSNLHASVTHEDIKELFEDIGPLVTSRLLRAGVAEVIYQQQKDAKKAVDAYHNRQLDGQPMKCLLVNPRPAAPASGVLRSSNMPATPKFPGSSKSTVVPDISAIHKALFTSK